jgi:mannose-6-phosphate isomerase-like protein (cupin superfamily)
MTIETLQQHLSFVISLRNEIYTSNNTKAKADSCYEMSRKALAQISQFNPGDSEDLKWSKFSALSKLNAIIDLRNVGEKISFEKNKEKLLSIITQHINDLQAELKNQGLNIKKFVSSLLVPTKDENYSIINIGPLDHLMEYSFLHSKTHQKIDGKVFVGEALQTTSMEISFQELPPQTEMPFVHKHRLHEEVYIFLKGTGQIQIDDAIFDVSEGTIVRIDPEGKRTWKNNSDSPLVFIVIQAVKGSLDSHTIVDGYRVEEPTSWK